MTTPTFDRPLTEDETALLNHIMMWGSDGYPIDKLGRKWSWSFRSLSAPRVYATKREAVAAFETFLSVLRECKAAEAQRRAIAARAAQLDAQERDTLQATTSAKAERLAQIEKLLDDEEKARALVEHVHRLIDNTPVTQKARLRALANEERLAILSVENLRNALVMLVPKNAHAVRRPSDGRVVFVTIP